MQAERLTRVKLEVSKRGECLGTERVMGVLPVAAYVEIVSFRFLARLLAFPVPDGNSIWNE